MTLRDQVLLVDADDTLWENEAWFQRAFDAFLERMVARGHDGETAGATARRVEAERCAVHGYGSRSFAESLIASARLLDGGEDPELEEELLRVGRSIFEHPIVPFPGVPATLETLATRHRLLLVTKGAADEQAGKIARSGLLGHFQHVEVLAEKDPAAYEEVVERHVLERRRTWMIGNSPRSDINPAQAIGLRTVHIPHHTLWEHEAEPLTAEPDLVLSRFADLTRHF